MMFLHVSWVRKRAVHKMNVVCPCFAKKRATYPVLPHTAAQQGSVVGCLAGSTCIRPEASKTPESNL